MSQEDSAYDDFGFPHTEECWAIIGGGDHYDCDSNVIADQIIVESQVKGNWSYEVNDKYEILLLKSMPELLMGYDETDFIQVLCDKVSLEVDLFREKEYLDGLVEGTGANIRSVTNSEFHKYTRRGWMNRGYAQACPCVSELVSKWRESYVSDRYEWMIICDHEPDYAKLLLIAAITRNGICPTN